MDVVTMLSLLISLGAFYYTYKSYKHNEKNNQKEQAKKISAHMTSIDNVKIENNSDAPIFDVFIVICSNKQDISNFNVWRPSPIYIDLLPPGSIEKKVKTAGHGCGGEKPSANILFTDSNGLKWCRNNKGNISEANDYKDKLKKIKIFPPY